MDEKHKPNNAMQSLQLQMELDNLMSLLPFLLERQLANAKIHKSRFDALIAEGFTESQALEIVGKRPLFE